MNNPCSKFDGRLCGLLLGMLALAVGTSDVSAQTNTDATEPPAGALLKTAPAMAQWTISFVYGEDGKAKDPSVSPDAVKTMAESESSRPRTIVTTKTGEIIHEETTTVGGAKTDDWQVHGNYYVKFPGRDSWSAYEKTDTSVESTRLRMSMILPASGFFGLDWIRKEAYAGKTKIASGDALVFVPGGFTTVNASASGAEAKLQSLSQVAYIDAETRFPVIVRVKGETRHFEFSKSPPASTLTLPPDLADEIKKGNEIRAQRNAAPGREF